MKRARLSGRLRVARLAGRLRVARLAALGLFALAALPATLVVLSFDARMRRHAQTNIDVVLAVAARLPSTDLAASEGARWLRTPSLEEPGAAFSDGPAFPDPDPAGGAISPPRSVWSEEASR